MDSTGRKITKIAREAERLVLLTLREESVGTAEIDLIHALRHHPGCTQAQLAELLHADKAAIARRTKNLESKGFLVRRADPSDKRSHLLVPTPKAEALKTSKAGIEAAFYEYLTSALTGEEAAVFAALLDKLYTVSKAESRAGFPNLTAREIAATIGYLGHDPELSADTVRSNVLCGSGGVRLSGGQAQRLALARTLAHPRPVLILDDPFSALDRKTEDIVFANLQLCC